MYPIYTVDAFVTQKSFSGNPAGVCLLDTWPTDDWMQNVAAEMNHAETAFVMPSDTGYAIRYFTPTIEIPLCGHATLASAHVLWEEGIVSRRSKITFFAKGGTLKVQRQGEQIQMDFPRPSFTMFDDFPDHVSDLNLKPLCVAQSDKDLVYELASEKEVRDYDPPFLAMKTLPFRMHIITAKSDSEDCDFVSRVFAPSAGINEDSATGIAHCILGPFWEKKLDQTTFHAIQASKRGAHLGVVLQEKRVLLLGNAINTLKGSLLI